MRHVQWFYWVLAFSVGLLIGCPYLPPDTERQVVNADGQCRTYLVHVPPSCDGSTRVPLVIALHPFATTARYMARTTGFNAVADEEGFIVVYPNARARLWNGDSTDGDEAGFGNADDVAFLDALLDELIASYPVEPSRVYICGASNGALMTQRAACELAHRFAAAASVMTTLPVGWEGACEPAGPLPMLLMQGVDDPFFPWEGGTVQQGPFLESEYGSAADMAAFWVANNGAVSPPLVTNLPDTDPDDGTTVVRSTYAANAGGAEVVFYAINGGGHTWPGSAPSMEWLVGLTSQDIDASRVIWEFFAQHPK